MLSLLSGSLEISIDLDTGEFIFFLRTQNIVKRGSCKLLDRLARDIIKGSTVC